MSDTEKIGNDLYVEEPLETYELSLSPDYVPKWGFWEAARELLQNSIDQHVENAHSLKVLEFEEPYLTIGNTFCSLPTKTLLLGVTNKRGSLSSVGEFGEGYKLALLVLTRLSYSVIVLNNDTIWVPRFEHSEKYGEKILTVSVHKAATPVNGVFFRIHDVSEHDFGKLTENYLGDAERNQILEEEHLRQRVFVNGLFVCKIAELRYGYNFSPDRLRLDRDRQIAATWEVKSESSRLWADSGDERKLYGALMEGIPDVSSVPYSATADTNNYVVRRYLAEHPNTIPVAGQVDIDRCQGAKTRVVPGPLRDMLRRLHKFVFNRQGTPSERLERFYQSFGHLLNAEAKREMEAVMRDSLQWNGPAEPAEATEREPVDMLA